MMTKIDLHKYSTVQQFQQDIELICCNALEYNPDRDPQGLYCKTMYKQLLAFRSLLEIVSIKLGKYFLRKLFSQQSGKNVR